MKDGTVFYKVHLLFNNVDQEGRNNQEVSLSVTLILVWTPAATLFVYTVLQYENLHLRTH